MKYKCVNQFDKFSFHDAELISCRCQGDTIKMEMSGVVARYNHPANNTLADRYTDTLHVRLKGASVKKLFLEGAKYYDANDVLQEEVPDTIIAPEEYETVFHKLKNAYIFTVNAKETDGAAALEIAADINDEDTYWLEVVCEKAVFEWEHFLNKASFEG